jgi:hypothetical protein
MSKEQIEEMAKILIDYKNKNHIMASTAILADYAEELYNADYRKQSDCDGLLLTFDGATGYFPKEFIIEAIKTHMKQSVGEWKQTKEPMGWHDVDCVECSACGESWVLDDDLDFDLTVEYWHYCPNCGAKMKGGAE